MTIYSTKNAIFEPTTGQGCLDNLPKRTSCSSFNSLDILHLQEFIADLYREGDLDSLSNRFLPSWLMYKNVFSELVVLNTSNSTPSNLEPVFTTSGKEKVQLKANLNAAVGNIVQSAFVAEAATMFAMWVLRKELKSDLDVLATSANTSDLSNLFKRYKCILTDIENNFTDPEKGDITLPDKKKLYIQYKRMLAPDTSIFDRIDIFEELMTTTTETLFKRKGDFENFEKSINNGKKKDLIIKILTELNEQSVIVIKEKAACFFKILGGEGNLPFSLLLGVGEGGGTQGLANVEKSGLIFFQYKFRKPIFGDFPKSKLKNTEPYQLPKKKSANQSVVLHFYLFGIDASISGSVEVELRIKGESTFKLKGTFELESTLIPASSGDDWISKGKPVATFDKDTRNLTFTKEFENKEIEITVISNEFSGGNGLENEEAGLLVNSYLDTLSLKLDLTLEDFYPDDRFELDIAQKGALFTQLIAQPLEELVRDVLSKKVFPLNRLVLNLFGGFVGREVDNPTTGNSLVEKDTTYIIPPGALDNVESPFPAPSQSAIRYSHASVSSATDATGDLSIILNIESYCSPVWSRLDRKFANDFRQTNPGTPPNITTLDALTHPTYLLVGVPAINPANGTTNIRSYNQALTALRCMSILEVLLEAIEKKARELEGLGTITTAELNDNVLVNIANIKLQAEADTFAPDLLGGQKTLSYTDFEAFKWYTSLIEQTTVYGKLQ